MEYLGNVDREGPKVQVLRVLLMGTLLLWSVGQTPARADGCFIPERSIAKLPGIPAQRALVAFRDGKETLIVESALEGEGKRFGWIIPVPARPESIEAASPGTLKSLAMGIQPRIIEDAYMTALALFTFVVCGMILLALFTWSLLRRKTQSWLASAGCSFLVFVTSILPGGLVFFVLMLFAGYGPFGGIEPPGGPGMPPGVTVLDRARVGSYDVAVVAADDAAALYKWLEIEGLAVPEALRPAADDYARSGWRFVTAKLLTDGSGQALPHPLRIRFKADRAVYPIRLTALSGSDLALELYVAGDQAASVPGMKRIFCDRFQEAASTWPTLAVTQFLDGANRRLLQGTHSKLALGHPDLKHLLWDGCWVSKLTGTLKPEAMKEDMVVSWLAPKPEQRTFFTQTGRLNAGWVAVLILLTAGLCITLIGWGLGRMSPRLAVIITAAAALAGAVAFATLQLALPATTTISHGGKAGPSGGGFEQVARRVREATYHLRDGTTTPATEAQALRTEAAGWINLYTGEPIHEEDSPGNYTLEVGDNFLVFTFYDLGGTPVDVQMKHRGSATP